VSYRAQVATAFEVLADGLAPFVDGRMSQTFPGEDWILMAATKLGKRRDVLVSLTDPHFQLEVLNRWWGPAFGSVLTTDLRQTVTDLRTARNHWAHPDVDHPFDFAYAMRVHQLADELLRAIDAPEADRMGELIDELRWEDVRESARSGGMSELSALLSQLGSLQSQYDDLQSQVEDARQTAQSATGRSRAVTRQLAELQTQYAAVAGLRDDYLALQRQMNDEQTRGEVPEADQDQLRAQLASAELALAGLQRESSLLRDQLADTRDSLANIDPLDTEQGRRLVWLVVGLVVLLGVLVVVAAYIPR